LRLGTCRTSSQPRWGTIGGCSLIQRQCAPVLAPGLTVSDILFAGHRGFRQIPEKTDDNQATCSPLHCRTESHSFPIASCWAASASRFDALRLCVLASWRLNGVGSNAETQRRKDAEWDWPRKSTRATREQVLGPKAYRESLRSVLGWVLTDRWAATRAGVYDSWTVTGNSQI